MPLPCALWSTPPSHRSFFDVDFILAIVEFMDGNAHRVHDVRRRFHREPDFGVTRVNYGFTELPARAEAPR